MVEVFDMIVVGAGIAGCAAFHAGTKAGLQVCLLEKSRGIGGRSAVRRGNGWSADLGAQFCNVTSEAWKQLFERESDQITAVDVEIFDKTTNETQKVTRYIHRNGMNAFAKKLLQESLSDKAHVIQNSSRLSFQTRVSGVSFDNSKAHSPCWNIDAISGSEDAPKQYQFKAKVVLFTAPLPQCLEIFRASALELASSSKEPLQQVNYSSCIAAIFEGEDISARGIPAIWKTPQNNLSGIFDQRAKGLATDKGVWVVHADADFSKQLWNFSDSAILAKIAEATQAAFDQAAPGSLGHVNWQGISVHKWRYCEPQSILHEPFHHLRLEGSWPAHSATALLLAGDAFIRSSIEGAFCSGHAAGLHAVHLLESSKNNPKK